MQTKVIITIDTEVADHDGPDAFDRDVLGCTPRNPRGAYWIAEQLKRSQLPGVFFLDVYGKGRYREARYEELCNRLLECGHDIQLHTHPDQMYDPNRFNMYQYSLEDQTGIIRDGMALLKEWTGKLPVAHRAGRYGANVETLKAIKANGIYLDSSFYYGRENCKLPFANSNAPFMTDGIWEFPVTIVPEPVVKCGFRFPEWSRHFWWRHQKLDVNTMNPRQLCRSVMELYGKIPYITTFLHSFSFARRGLHRYEPDEAAIAAFQALLQLLVAENIPVVTFEQLAADFPGEKNQACGVLSR